MRFHWIWVLAGCAFAADGDGMTPLHWAVYRDDAATVRPLIASGADVKATTRVGDITPLSLACTTGDSSVIDLLLKAVADVNAATADGATPLMLAAGSGSADAAKVLPDHGANVNAKEGAHGQTALMFAAAKNQTTAIEVLLKSGADTSATTRVEKLERPRVDEDGNPLPASPAGGAGRGRQRTGGRAGGGSGGQARGRCTMQRTPSGRK
jgi:hypothetical protein